METRPLGKNAHHRRGGRDFEQLRADLIKEHNPQWVLESELVERLAVILWRLRRVPCFEAAILDARHQQVWNQKNYCLPEPEGEEKEEEKLDQEESDWERSVDLRLALMDGRYGDTLGKIERHETTLMNDLTKTLQTLLLLRHDLANKDDATKPKVVAEPKRVRCKEHLRFVASQPCLVCGRFPSQAHHLRHAQSRSLSLKVSDEFTVPLCAIHHRDIHTTGKEREWWQERKIDPLKVASDLWQRSRAHYSTAREADRVQVPSTSA